MAEKIDMSKIEPFPSRQFVYHDPCLPELIRAAVQILNDSRTHVMSSQVGTLQVEARDFLLRQFDIYKRFDEESKRYQERHKRTDG